MASTHLDKFLKFSQEFLLIAIGVGKRFLVASLELVPVKGCQMSRCARRSLAGVFVAVEAISGLARLWGLDLRATALMFGKGSLRICHNVGKHRFRKIVSGYLRLWDGKNG